LLRAGAGRAGMVGCRAHHRPHLIEPPGGPGQTTLPSGKSGGGNATVESEFHLLVINDCCHNIYSVFATSVNGGVRQKPSEQKEISRCFWEVIPKLRSGQSEATQDWTGRNDSLKVSLVPSPSKSTSPNPAPKTAVPFEEALQKLESIVEAMESGDLPLEQLIARYEEGVKLAKVCQEKLAEAELKIQQLEKTSAGELKLKPLTADLSEE